MNTAVQSISFTDDQVSAVTRSIRGLPLALREGEQILIGDSVILELRQVTGDKARLVIRAPRSMPVDRLKVRLQRLCSARSPGVESPSTPDQAAAVVYAAADAAHGT